MNEQSKARPDRMKEQENIKSMKIQAQVQKIKTDLNNQLKKTKL